MSKRKTQEKKDGRGGYRENAGRKKLKDERGLVKSRPMGIHDDQLAKLDLIVNLGGARNRSEALRKILDATKVGPDGSLSM